MVHELGHVWERFKLVDSSLKGLDAPLVPRIRRLGSFVRGPPAAQLNNASEDRQTPHRPPTWIAGTRHGQKPPAASFS